MPITTVYRHGLKAGVAPMKNDHQRVLRGDVGGWSEGATRRNTQFLYSVEEHKLTGRAYAVTLTLRECPPDSGAWHRLRRAWIKRMERAGMIRLHWVTEWQRRGVPHLHGVVFFPDDIAPAWARRAIVHHWLEIAESAGLRGQHVKDITGIVGWFQYLSKHAARGVQHYQRNPENIPPAWRRKTGRMWGKVGDWPTRDGMRIDLQDQHGDGGFFAFRRLVRSWRIADARASGSAYRLRSARGMLKCCDRALSTVRGVSEWIGQDVALAMLANLAVRGYAVQS